MTADRQVPSIDALLREAAAWRLLQMLFSPPDARWREELPALAAEAGDEALAAVARTAADEASEALYHSTFGPGGPAAPREVSYRAMVQPGGLLTEVCGAYAAFGYAPSDEQPPDHVAVEAGFVAYLRLKEAFARFHGDAAAAERTAAAAAAFMADHLARIAAPLAESLGHSGIHYLAAAAAVLAERVGPPPPTPFEIVSESESLC